MDFRFPQTFVSVDVADSAQNALVEQNRFDAGLAGVDATRKFVRSDVQRIRTEAFQFSVQRSSREICYTAESARIGVAQLAAVVERESNVCMFRERLFRSVRRQVAGHSEVHQQRL